MEERSHTENSNTHLRNLQDNITPETHDLMALGVSQENKAHGDELPLKDEHVFRLFSQNANGISPFAESAEDQLFRENFQYSQANVTAISELNIHWRNVTEENKLPSRMATWFESNHQNITYNTTHKPQGTYQIGGTAIFSVNKACHRIMKKGSDPSGLGRWCWTRYRGRDGLTLRVVSVYCPHDKGEDLSVYAQHRFWYNQNGQQRIPRVAFWEDK